MASAVTRWGATELLNIVFGRRLAAPSEFYVALLSQAPGEHTDGTLLSEPPIEAGYARAPLANDALSWGTAVNGVIATTASVVYPTAVADWPVITHYALCDALVGGNVWLYGSFTLPRLVSTGHAARIPANTLALTAGSLSTALIGAF